MRPQQGISLTEVLVALFLSSFIMMTLMQHYLTTKKQYHHLQTTLEERIDLQLVTEIMRNSIRKAGFTPCLSIDDLISLDQRNSPQNLAAIEVPTESNPTLQINRMNENFDTVLDVESPMQLLMTSLQTRHRYHSILIADCYHAEVQQVSERVHAGSTQRIKLSKPLAFEYHDPIYVGEWVEERYFVRKDKNGKASLFYQHHHPEELTTAVHALSAQLKLNNGRKIVDIQLGLDNAPTLLLETMVRAG